MKRALVTGATGFVGSALVAALQGQGWSVQALGRRQGPVETIPFNVLTAPDGRMAEILDASRPHVIFHLAGTTGGSAEEMERVNFGFAEALLEAAAKLSNVPRIVLAGSSAEYGELGADALPVRESHLCVPTTLYGATKLRQTQLGLEAARAGLPVYLPRMFNLVGAGMGPHLSLGRFAREIASLGPTGGVLTTGPLDAKRDFVSVHDAVRVLIGLWQLPDAVGHIVNLCSGVAFRIADMLDALLAASGAPISIVVDRSISGVNAIPVMVGCTQRLEALGFRVGPPDLRAEMASLLASCDAERQLISELVE